MEKPFEEQVIEDFLTGNLSESEHQDFEIQMTENADLKEQVELHRLTMEGLQNYKVKQFSDKIKQVDHLLEKEGFFDVQQPVEKQKLKTSSNQQLGWKKYLAYAAGFLFFAIAIYYFNNATKLSSEKRFAQNYEKAPDLISDELSRRITGIATSNKERWMMFNTCMEKYNQLNTAEAIICLEGYIEQYSEDREAQLYAALSLLDQGANTQAIKYFEQLDFSANKKWRGALYWYHALALIKADDSKGAISLLGKIEIGDAYYKQALKLREEME